MSDLLSFMLEDLPDEFVDIVDITKGNPGAMSVCNQLVEAKRTDLFPTIKDFSTGGHELWLVYKDVCRQGLQKSIRLLELIRDGKVPAEDVLVAGNERNMEEIQKLMDLVMASEEREKEKEKGEKGDGENKKGEEEREEEREEGEVESKNVEEKGLEGEGENKKGEKESEIWEKEDEKIIPQPRQNALHSLLRRFCLRR